MKYAHVYYEYTRYGHAYRSAGSFVISFDDLFLMRLKHKLTEKQALEKIIEKRSKLLKSRYLIKEVTWSEEMER